ncbi:MAG TPA: DinB family protein [Flavisolibacter sp.]|nr:DinB family protein [Flavisolibacter sp.]
MKPIAETFIKMALDAWHTQIKQADDLFNSLSDEQLMQEVVPGRNRGVYLLGHLTAVHDRMMPLLGLGDQRYSNLYKTFVEGADKAEANIPPIEDLRNYWKEVNNVLSEKFSSLSFEEWFQRHNAVSEVDFAKEPHRNKLNVVINRTNHLANHLGQLLLLKPRSED